MGRIWGALCALACVLLVACVSPEVTHCPTVDCPQGKVCDNRGGCAFPEQLSACVGQSDGTACSYPGVVNASCAGGLCVPNGCGNSQVTSDEVCDDGNTVNGDGCSADCRSNETCGNGTVDSAKGEQCDDNNTVDGDGCQHDCQLPRCGDGVKDVSLSEECDSGSANANTPDASCRTNCQLPRCGDGVTDPGQNEVCDDTNNQSGDGCSGDCKSNETCGNHVIDTIVGEVCDDGNTTGGDGCSANCKSQEVCGNGVLDAMKGEVCDDANTVSGDGCSADCKSLEVCGNGVLDSITEQCDLGTMNSNAPDSACRVNCKLPTCGDGIKDVMHGEACDMGVLNANAPNACRTNCQLPRCGDTIQDTGEVCDDGNTTPGDGCSADCKSLETCGNGITDVAKGEQCDDANTNQMDSCHSNCKIPVCGDGLLDPLFGEACDMGAMNSNAANAACRTNCQPSRCGDGATDTNKGEVCDDGNTVAGDGCAVDCKSNETCGNGITDVAKGEQCDDGNMVQTDGCHNNCKLPACGDGILDSNEACDAGTMNSNLPNAACRTNCQLPRCGDGVTDTTKGEVCDDGNTTPGDGCAADCKSAESCGNGIVDVAKGEQCDDGNTVQTDGCHNNCKIPTCGDGLLDTAFGEACDLGTSNSNGANATCRTNCQPQRCGDGVTDNMKGEVCDDSNTASGDGCSADCKSNETCGNGITDVAKGEQCDDGNTVQTDSCHNNCKIPRCGDNIVDTAFNEQCDLGASNSNAPNSGCRTTCVLPKCGDAIVDNLNGEVCDDGNSVLGDGCRPDCLSTEVCGNGILDPENNEQCDDGNTRGRDGCSKCLPEVGIVYQPGAAPSARDMNALVYDAGRQRVVMFGGWTPAGNLNDTYEWDGASWVQMHPKHAPKGRLAPAVAYDPRRHRIVLFGGYSANFGVSLSDTWEYDGVDWTQKSPTTVPAARAEAAMAYDVAGGRIVMYGGYDGTAARSDMLAWDGTNWSTITTAGAPGTRQGAAMAYDAKDKYIVLFGGAGVNKRTWTWNGSAWTDRGNTAVISAVDIDQTSMTYDANLQKIVLWDGTANSYQWDGSTNTWSAVANGAGTPVTPRSRFSIAYDAIRKQIVLFGGCQGASATTGTCQQGFGTDFADTWLRTGTTWAAAPAFTQPTARLRAGAAYDPIRRKTVMFGGQTKDRRYNCTAAGCMPNEIWEWDGHKWALNTTATGTPTGRGGQLMDYDSSARAIKVYAGDSYDGTNDNFYSNIYNFSGTAWTSLTATGRALTQTPTMSYDSFANRLISFGGSTNPLTNFTTVNTTYYWDTAGWHQISPTTNPPARRGSQAAYDPVRRRTVMFSGNPGNGTSLADTWEFDGTNWTKINAPSGPTERIGGHVYFNSDLGKVCVFGNAGQIDGEDLWEWNGTVWSERTLIGAIPSKYESATAYDAANQELVTFGGRASGSTGGPTQGTFMIQYEPNTAVESCTSAQVDYDNDGKAGCADEECWGVCTPLCPPGTTCAMSAPRCGDMACSANENCDLCPQDCGACVGTCGDYHCDSGETNALCPLDCPP